MNDYKLSIVIPIYNVEDYIMDCLDSIVKQTVIDDIEVLLIDDGSTDNSGNIAKNYANNYTYMHYYYKDNGGLSSARNTGIKFSRGKYIAYVDSDDYIESNYIETLLQIINNNIYDLIIISGYKILPDLSIVDYGPSIKGDYETGLELYDDMKNRGAYYTGVYYQVVKRSLLKNCGIDFYNGILHEDHLYTFEILLNAKKTISIPDKLYNYRIRNNSIMTKSSNNLKRFLAFSVTLEEMLKVANHLNVETNSNVHKHLLSVAEIVLKKSILLNCNEFKLCENQIRKSIQVVKRMSLSAKLYVFLTVIRIKLLIVGVSENED